MKNWMITLVLALSIVGCANDGKKVAEKMNDEGQAAQSLAEQGAKEYLEAYNAPALSKMSVQELDATRAKYVSSRSNLNAARAKYQHVLDLEKDNKGSVKLIGKQSVIDTMARIDAILSDIDTRIQNIDATKKARLAEGA